jgi:50S ribosomal protein L16 3-hydroxylase
MQAQAAAILARIKWRRRDIEHFLGCYLTEPKSHVVFTPPRPLPQSRFLARVHRYGLALSLRSRMLFDRDHLYLNGEAHVLSRSIAVLKTLANTGALPAYSRFGLEVADLLYEWYRAGYVELPPAPARSKSRRE